MLDIKQLLFEFGLAWKPDEHTKKGLEQIAWEKLNAHTEKGSGRWTIPEKKGILMKGVFGEQGRMESDAFAMNDIFKTIFIYSGSLKIIDKHRFFKTVQWEEKEENYLPMIVLDSLELNYSTTSGSEIFLLTYENTNLIKQAIKQTPKKAKLLSSKASNEYRLALTFDEEGTTEKYYEILRERFYLLEQAIENWDWSPIFVQKIWNPIVEQYLEMEQEDEKVEFGKRN